MSEHNACQSCKKQDGEVNHPAGMVFVGWGRGWEPCTACGGSGLASDAPKVRAITAEERRTLLVVRDGESPTTHRLSSDVMNVLIRDGFLAWNANIVSIRITPSGLAALVQP